MKTQLELMQQKRQLAGRSWLRDGDVSPSGVVAGAASTPAVSRDSEAPRRAGLQGPVLKLTSTLVIEWRYRVLERLGILCEDRVPKPDQLALAEAEANEWLAAEMAYNEVERELPIYSATSTRNFQPA